MPTTTYTAITQEEGADLATLSTNHYNLQVAKSVSTPGGSPTYNVVYRSSFLAYNMSVAWTTTYGINWTIEIPTQGAQITYAGRWQSCALGQSYDLDQKGEWVANQKNPYEHKDSVNVGGNHYPIPVHIIVGVQDPATLKWTPSVRLWFEEGTKTATMISTQGTEPQEFDMTSTPLFYFSYATTEGKWRAPQPGPFF
ncbi:hypothetical protein N7462_006859 [Penicillium macrosclerotiorum]|uniref:uncharacterized protein n=1 Tax=Penicillium macrosclerotiorum TaxID=303699 RepID=UPI00254837A0|nr:uncharacterized protein N7462_006859 [Penicillium macrosclerotiorum]KAJ5678615.1 hypothetical protein N7462_006859 [Penicillium macrosclerotiorum]